MLRFVWRVLIVWTIDVVVLLLLAEALPGLSLATWRTAIWGVAALGLLNALVRPIVLFLALPFTVLTLGFVTLLINALMLHAAGLIVPGLVVADFGTATIGALGLTAANTLATSLLALNDEDSFYRNVVLRIARRSAPPRGALEPGLIIVEIDGLAAPALREAIRAGHVPTLARWSQSGSHRVVAWDCGLPSQTSSSQAGILYGDNFDIPAFRWYEKGERRLLVSNHPADAAEIDRRASTGNGLLRRDGACHSNIISGDAARSLLTMSTLADPARSLGERAAHVYFYFFNPYNFSRVFLLMLAEIAIEVWQGLRQRLRDERPRVARGGAFPLLRAVSSVLLRDLNVYFMIEDMFSGVAVTYSSFVGYDVVAHHAGPNRGDALRALASLDRQIAALERAAQRAPRPYHFVVLSDHGQSDGAPFRQRFGQTLEELVRALLRGEHTVSASVGKSEGWGYLNALLSEAAHSRRRAGRAVRRVLRRRTRDGYVEFGARDAAPLADANVVVCASGNLGLIYFADWPDRLTFETIVAAFPGLIEGLVEHPGIGFALVRSELHGPLVLGRGGVRHLANGLVEGADPLAPFGPRAAEHLRRLDGFPHVADVVVNSCYDPDTGEVASFEEMVGSHGGLGGPQTMPFLMFPAGWAGDDLRVGRAPELYAVLRGWLDRLQTPALEAGAAE